MHNLININEAKNKTIEKIPIKCLDISEDKKYIYLWQ